MGIKTPTKRIVVRIFGPDGTRVVVGDSMSDVQLITDFQCVMSTKPERNSGRVSITNMSEATRNILSRAVNSEIGLFQAAASIPSFATAQANNTLAQGHAYCTVDAGTDADVGRVFEGSVESIRSVQSGPEWTTEILISDGQATAGVEIDERWPKDTQLFDVLNLIRKRMSLEAGNFTREQLLASLGAGTKSRIGRPFAIKRSADSIFNEIFTLTGAEWWVDRGALYVVRKGGILVDRSFIVSSAHDELRSAPEQLDKSAVKIQTDFRRALRIGRGVVVDYGGSSAKYRADQVVHQLNNYDGDFASAAILRTIPKAQ